RAPARGSRAGRAARVVARPRRQRRAAPVLGVAKEAPLAYLKPPLFVRRIFNPIAMAAGIGGSKPLSVRRRRSGGTQRVLVVDVEHGGARYLVSPRGET